MGGSIQRINSTPSIGKVLPKPIELLSECSSQWVEKSYPPFKPIVPGARFSKVPLYLQSKGVSMHLNFAVILIFIPFTTHKNPSFTE